MMASEGAATMPRDGAAEAPSRVEARGSLAARILLMPVAAVLLFGAFVADWNVTHIYNPTWPPHAKFHNAQTMLLSTALGACTVVYAWRPDPTGRHLRTAILFASLYWITQAASMTFPGTAFTDPDRVGAALLGIPLQLVFEAVMLGLVGMALVVSRPPSAREASSATPSSGRAPALSARRGSC